jgi:hypothetical protein
MRLRGLVILMFRDWSRYVWTHRDVDDHPRKKSRIRTQTSGIRNNSPSNHLLRIFLPKSTILAHKGILKLGNGRRDNKRPSKTAAYPRPTQFLVVMTHALVSTNDRISRILHALR